MTPPVGVCHVCRQPIEKRTDAVVAVRGYEQLREQGGQNAVLYKERVGDWIAHKACLDERKRGAPLFELEAPPHG